MRRPVCVEKPLPVTAPNVHLCVYAGNAHKCDGVSWFRSAVLLNYLSAFYSEPPTLLFPSPSQAKHLSFHSWVNLYSTEMGSQWQTYGGRGWGMGAKSTIRLAVFHLTAWLQHSTDNTKNQSLSTVAQTLLLQQPIQFNTSACWCFDTDCPIT